MVRLLEIILPLSLIGFVSIATLYIKDISFENLGEASVGTFGIITFSIALSYVTPSSDYLTKADILFWMTFVVVLSSFMTIIVINARYRPEQLEGVRLPPDQLRADGDLSAIDPVDAAVVRATKKTVR